MFIITESGVAVNLDHVASIKATSSGSVLATGPSLAEEVAAFHGNEWLAQQFISTLLESGETICADEDDEPCLVLSADSVKEYVLREETDDTDDDEEYESQEAITAMLQSAPEYVEPEESGSEWLERLFESMRNSQN